MHRSAAVVCHDKSSLKALGSALESLGIELTACTSGREALEMVVSGECGTLIVDFDLPGAEEVIRMAALLPPTQKPALLAVASRVWPGTGQAFQSGASRILYRPLDADQLKDALKSSAKRAHKTKRKSARYEMKTLVYLEHDSVTTPGISIDIGEHGMAVQATEPIPVTSNLPFRCVLPGTDFTLQGHADVIWASDQGRAGLFFSKLTAASKKHLKTWLHKRSHHKDGAHELIPPTDVEVHYAATE
ncbi:MAG TPA: PilZ domain-containing protein [Candidatus Solibacter sp.]|nr:PilZ domain-containing protein [Candidatus Solibacter sp.]